MGAQHANAISGRDYQERELSNFFIALSFFVVSHISLAAPINNAITLPADVSGISYPSSYSSAISSTVEVADPYCNLTPSTISYPASYLGAYSLPTQSGAFFPSSVQFGASLKDVWQVGNPTFNTGCTGDVRAAFLQTLLRMKALGATFIKITPWTFVNVSNPTWEIVNPAVLNTSTMSDTDLEWAVAKAHEHGLEVHWVNQIQGAIGSSIPAATVENVTKFIVAYESYMLERAAFLQRINVDVMMVGCICWFIPQGETETIFATSLSNLAPRIKAIFSGKLSTLKWGNLPFYSDLQLMNSLDIVELTLWTPNLSSAELQSLNISILKTKYAEMISGMSQSGSVGSSKKILWLIVSPSRSDYFTTTGHVEETFCTSGFNVISQLGELCIQNTKQADYSLQAMVYEAQLEAIRDQTHFQTYGVAADGYWMTDNIMPNSTFPNIAGSIRNKPAEALMRQWFNPWLNGVGVSQSNCIFNWAEINYAQFFSPAATSTTSSPYTYRYYSATGNYLATSSADSHIWVLGSSFGSAPLDVGAITSFLGASGCQ